MKIRRFRSAERFASAAQVWLLGAVIAVVAVAVAFFALGGYRDYDVTLEKGWSEAETTAHVLAEQASRMIEISEILTAEVADAAIRDGLDHVTGPGWPRFLDRLEPVPQIGSLWVLDAEGNVLASSFRPVPPAASFADSDYFQRLHSGTRVLISPLMFGQFSRVWFFGYNRAIVKDGAFLGVVQVSIHADHFKSFFERLTLGPDAAIGIYDNDGAVVMRWPLPENGAPTGPGHLLPPGAMQAAAGRLESTSPAGVPLLVAYRRLDRAPLVVAAAVSKDDVLAPFRTRLAWGVMLLGIGGVIVSVLGAVAFGTARRERAAQVMERAAARKLAATLADRNHLVQSLQESERRFEQIAAAIGDVFWIAEPEARRFIYVSPAYVRLWGRSAEALYHDANEWSAAVHPDDRERLRDSWSMIAAGRDLQYRIIHPDGSIRWIRDHGFPVADVPGRFAGIAADVTDLVAAEAAERAESARMRVALRAGGLAAFALDVVDGGFVHDPALAEMLGLPADARIATEADFIAAIHPEDRDRCAAEFRKAFTPGGLFRAEFRVVRPDGQTRWLIGAAEGVRNAAGIVQAVGFTGDITERKLAHDRQALLIRELHHRVKNILSVAQAIAGISLRSVRSLEEFREVFSERLVALGRTHSLLIDSGWAGAQLSDLFRLEFEPYADRAHQLHFDGPQVLMPPGTVVTFGLAVHELVTNSAKYGALSVPDGRIDVTWRVEAGASGRRLRIDWVETGGQPPAAPKHAGFGTQLLQKILPGQLRAEVKVDYSGGGLRVAIDAPLPAEGAPDPSPPVSSAA
ncbi:PAS domain-containing protein [Blastochloris tepida]|uniref:Blue-light-activated histidine kinase n=1 Tax=Blastochloris tepida TaxID=2233851 RepID=A0A348G3N5_9HYPH|nr:PAS domain-containing protein [Blastochloris tepida]BBF94168.1 hypothetical protein BLTE_28530 [Blastochloris tepida]